MFKGFRGPSYKPKRFLSLGGKNKPSFDGSTDDNGTCSDASPQSPSTATPLVNTPAKKTSIGAKRSRFRVTYEPEITPQLLKKMKQAQHNRNRTRKIDTGVRILKCDFHKKQIMTQGELNAAIDGYCGCKYQYRARWDQREENDL